jgi:hypothetical protein
MEGACMSDGASGQSAGRAAVVTLSRDRIEAMDLGAALRVLNPLLESSATVRACRDSLAISVSGYEQSTRRLYEIDEARAYIGTLDEEWPYWFYFVPKRGATLRMLTACVCRITDSSLGLPQLHDGDFIHFLRVHFEALRSLCRRFDLDDGTGEEVGAAVARYYGLDDWGAPAPSPSVG